MKNTSNVQKTNSISKKVGKVAAVVVALLVLIFALLLLLAPMKASDMFATLGMKNLSATMAYSAADKSDSFEDWWIVFERAVDADDYQMVCTATDKIEKHADFSALIQDKKVDIKGVSHDGKFYVVYQRARCSLLSAPEKAAEIWTWCEVRHTQYGWGSYISTNNYSLNAIKGYIDALVQNDQIPLGDFFDKAEDIYSAKGIFENVYYGQRNDFTKSVMALVNARADEIDQTTKDLWQKRYEKI